MIRSSRKLALFVGVLALLAWLALAASGVSLLLTAPLAGMALLLVLIGLFRRLSRKRRYLAPLALTLFTLTAAGTLGLFFLIGADVLARAAMVLLLTVGALASLRAFYIWGPRRSNGLSRYYDA